MFIPPGERFPSVGDQELAMVPQVGRPPAVEGERRHEGRHLPARLPKRPHGSSQRPPRSHGVEKQSDADPFPRPRGKRLDEPAPDGVDVEDEELRVQMVTGGSDQGEDGLVCLVPAAKEGDAVPFRRWRRSRREEDPAAPLPDVGGELLGPKSVGEGRGDRPDGGDLGADVPADPLDADQEIEGDSDQRQECDAEHPRQGRRGVAPLEDDPGDQEEGEDVPGDVQSEKDVLPDVVHSLASHAPEFRGRSCMLEGAPSARYNTAFPARRGTEVAVTGSTRNRLGGASRHVGSNPTPSAILAYSLDMGGIRTRARR